MREWSCISAESAGGSKGEAKKAANKRRLLEAAFELFSEKGAEGATVEQIARKAGLAKGTFYLYFKDKQDVTTQLIQAWTDRLLDDVWKRCYPPEEGCDGVTFMARVTELAIDELARDKKRIEFIRGGLSFELFTRITANPYGGEPVNMLDAIIETLEKGGIKMQNPRIAIFMAFELIAGACYQAITFEKPLPVAQMKPYLFKAVEGIVKSL